MESQDISSYIGNMTTWAIYHKNILVPVNKYFKTTHESEVNFLRKDWGITLEVMTEWGPWGKCEVCENPPGQATKTRTGYCRIKPKNNLQQATSVNIFSYLFK